MAEIIEALDSTAFLIKLFAAFIIGLAAFITASVVIYKVCYSAFEKATTAVLAPQLADMDKKIDELKESNDKKIDELWADLNKRLDDLEKSQKELKEDQEEAAIEACKNFLTHALADVEKGANDEVLKERIHDAHTWYNNHHQNSYIDTKFNKLVAEGKL